MSNLEKTYIVFDLQDINDKYQMTLREVKTFLYRMWEELEENDPFIEAISGADVSEVKSMLLGCDYMLVEDEQT
ncbi:hypothetical protein SAMN05192533_10822 [Mesobacillus persicus]|uniref:Uncharacterized protein n=1 Tax=Mesobacillus persicus TaxID=930146 RepID=A0A1H8D046_9BACI|nr:hypothetical protein [Mesobacillus persicus]SEN00640.1 hypothetical protein SAMN05192533_10822 [Mesobacillus persicus]